MELSLPYNAICIFWKIDRFQGFFLFNVELKVIVKN